MFTRKPGGDPDDRDGLQPGGVREKLPEMAMVCLLKLIFNQDPVAGRRIFAQDVSAKGADIALHRFAFQFNPDLFAE